jgi:hypothetical protein
MKKLYNKLLPFWPIAFILCLWFIFAFPYLFQSLTVFPSTYLANFFPPWNAYPGLAGPVKNGAMPDIIGQIYPWKIFTIETFKSGQIPLWNPYTFSGTTHLANYQSAVLTPLNLLFFILPFVKAWNILVLLQPILAGIFMYLYVRILKLSNSANLLSSISFMFCGFITTWMGYATLGYAIIYLPLALFAIEKFLNTNHHKYLFLLAFTFPLSFFSGHFQISLYFTSLIATYIVFKLLTSKDKKPFLSMLMYLFAGLLFTLPQVLPTMESYLQSLRSTIFIKAEAIPWGYLPTFLAPDFFGNPVTRNDWFGHYAEWNAYIGLMPLMLGVYALSLVRKNKYVLYFLIVSLITILLSFQSPVVDLLVFLKIPVISTSAVSRIIVLFSFSFAVLAGFGFDKLLMDLKKKNIKVVFSWLTFFVIIFAALWLIVLLKLSLPLDKIIVTRQNLLLPTCIFIVTSFLILIMHLIKGKNSSKFINLISLILILLVAFDMYRFTTKWMPKDPQSLVYPNVPVTSEFSKLSHYERFVSNLGGEAAIYYEIPSLDGYDAVYNQRYGEFIASLSSGNLSESGRSVVSFPKLGLYSKSAMDLLGTKYVIHKVADGHAPWAYPVWNYSKGEFSNVYNDGVYQIFKNNNAFPRVFLVNKYIVEKNPQKILNLMFKKGVDLRNEAMLEQNPNLKLDGTGSAAIKKYTTNKISIEASSTGNNLLFLSDAYYPGWKAYIDGKETKIYRSDFAFRAIFMPKGEHKVEFIYNPFSFTLGVYAAVLGLILMFMGALFRRFILQTRI